MTELTEVPGQVDLLDALERVERNAAEDWKTAARAAVGYLCTRSDPFTTDDAWSLLTAWDVPATHEPRAMGAIIREASRSGLIVKTGDYVESKRPESHCRPLPVWRVAA